MAKKLSRLPKSEERIGQYSTYRAAMSHAKTLKRETGIAHRVVLTTVPRWAPGMRSYTTYECYTVTRAK